MERDYITENQLAERYLQGKLSSREEAAFEEAFLSSTELLDELETAELLSQGLNDLAALEPDRRMQAQPTVPDSKASWLASLFHSPRYAMAASFLLLVSLGVSSTLLHRLGEQGSSHFATTAQIVPLVSVRGTAGSQTVNTIQVGDGDRQFVLMIDPGFDNYSHYRATVNRLNSATAPVQVWQADGLQPGYEEMLALAISSNLLEPGEYRVVVEAWRDEWSSDHAFEPVDTLAFRVVRAAANP